MSGLRFDWCPGLLRCGSHLRGWWVTFFEEALLVEDGDCVDEEEDCLDECAQHLSINN